MKPLEAVARALATANNDDWDVLTQGYHGRERIRDHMRAARAAITALRDAGVTEGMVNAAHEEGETASFGTVLRAMLDAVLEEE